MIFADGEEMCYHSCQAEENLGPYVGQLCHDFPYATEKKTCLHTRFLLQSARAGHVAVRGLDRRLGKARASGDAVFYARGRTRDALMVLHQSLGIGLQWNAWVRLSLDVIS